MKQNGKSILGHKDISAYNVPAVDRAAQILLLLGAGTREMTLAEIASATGFHKSSVHKILVTLNRHGFLDRDEATKRYSLGIALVRCGQSVLSNLPINQSAKSFLKELADFSGETANLAILRGNKMVIVDITESSEDGLRVTPPIGTMDPITAKSNGKAVLAFLHEEQREKILREERLTAATGKSITKLREYRNELTLIREQGYATDSEEFREGINAVSAPVFNSSGKIIGTLSIVGPAFRMSAEKMHLYGKKCVDAAYRLSPLIR